MIPTHIHQILNFLGHYDMEVTGKGSGDYWFKWKKVLELTELDEYGWKKYTERTIAPCEVVLDYDGFTCKRCKSEVNELTCPICHRKYTKMQFKRNMKIMINSVIKQLDDENYKYRLYETGGRGYHIHMIFPMLNFCEGRIRQQAKTDIIKKFNGELMKATNRVMITMEGSKHRKSGKPKKLLIEKRGLNY